MIHRDLGPLGILGVALIPVNERYGDLSPVETIAGVLDYFRLADHSFSIADFRSIRSSGARREAFV